MESARLVFASRPLARLSRLHPFARFIACALGLCVVMQTSHAFPGQLRIGTGGGTRCHGSSGYGASAFRLGWGAQNQSGVVQYLICGFPGVRDPAQAYDTSGSTGYALAMQLSNFAVTGPAHMVCAAVMGKPDLPASRIVIAKTVDVAASTGTTLTFTAAELPIKGEVDLVVNCALPPYASLGLLSAVQPKNF